MNIPSLALSGPRPRQAAAWAMRAPRVRLVATLLLAGACASGGAQAQITHNAAPYALTPEWVDDRGPLPGGRWAESLALPGAAAWEQDTAARARLLHALHNDGFANVALAPLPGGVALHLSDTWRRSPLRALSRASRIALAYLPLSTRTLEIRLDIQDMAGPAYRYDNLPELRRYFSGDSTDAALAKTIHIAHGNSQKAQALPDPDSLDRATAQYADMPAARAQAARQPRESIRSAREAAWFGAHGGGVWLQPYASLYQGAPGGGRGYDAGLKLAGQLRIAPGWWLQGALGLSAVQDLPRRGDTATAGLARVRSGLADYGSPRARVDSALIHRYWQAGPRWYFRASAGWYEAMYGGIGAQALYVSPSRNWTFDVAADRVRLRERAGLGFESASHNTALLSAHYRPAWAERLTLTARAGRFLAGDLGARAEIAYTLPAGVEVGAWYARSQDRDAYGRDANHGFFMRVPLSLLLGGAGSVSQAAFQFSRWPGDAAQMLDQPADLARTLRSVLRTPAREDDLGDFADLPPGGLP
ncbi:Putative outer membrane lipoprotein [plant metagenome]